MEPVATKSAFADGLRKAADLIEASPTLSKQTDEYASERLLIYIPGNARKIMANIARELPGRVNKNLDDDYLTFVKDCGGEVSLQVYASRSATCERVVVGTEQVSREVEVEVKPAEKRTAVITEEREIVEWRCEPLLVEAAA